MLDVRVSVWWWWSLIVCIYMWMSVYSLHATRFPSIASVHCVLKVLFISFCPCSDRMNWEVGEERRYLHWNKKKTVIIQKYQCDCAGACNDDLHHCMVCIQCLPRWQRRQHTYSFQLFHLYSFLCTGESIKPHTHFIFFLPLAFYSTTFFIIRIFMFCRWIFIIIL